jgi:hypothetical protein
MKREPQALNTRRRTSQWLWAGVVGVLAMVAVPKCGAQTNVNNDPTFDSFRIISQRNIFDPNRRAGYQPTTHVQQSRPMVSYFGLVGTMSYSKGKFAFFDGNNSDYRKVLEPGGSIAGYTVKDITNQTVTLAAGGKEIEMKVGSQMRNQNGGEWQLSAEIEQPTNTESETGTGSVESAASSAPPAGSSPEMNDVLKRLMEKRQQELK